MALTRNRLALALIALGACSTASAQFTAAQAAAGATAYQTSCSSCHAADLGGRNEAPQLAGSNFVTSWGTRTAGELVAFMQSSMPPGNPGGLGEAAYGNLGAYILQSNGAAPGTQPLTRASTVVIRSIATGRTSVTGAAAVASGPTGLTVSGVVKNYVPVTDEMLRNPDPGDWLMIRRNYQAWSYSPLTSDHRGERKESDAGVGLGDDGRRRQRAHADRSQRHHLSGQPRQRRAGARRPHGQSDLGEPHRPRALDGPGRHAQPRASIRTRFSSPPPTRVWLRSMRAPARIVWESTIADKSKGYANSSGPIVIHGKIAGGPRRLRPL